MGNYYIIPATKDAVEIAAASPEEALAVFAADVCSDTVKYFRAVTNDEYVAYVYNSRAEATEAFIKDFYRNELRENFSEEIPEDAVDDCADNAYQIYCRGDGHTEYEALEQAVDEYLENKEKAEGGQ